MRDEGYGWQTIICWARAVRRDGFAVWYACRDPRTPWSARLFAGLIVAYALSPIDLIPDFIPVLGLLDEMILLPIMLTIAIRMIPAEVMSDARARADRHVSEGGRRPRSFAGAALIIALWVAAAVAVWLLIRQRSTG